MDYKKKYLKYKLKYLNQKYRGGSSNQNLIYFLLLKTYPGILTQI